ncbi:RagB/SusD family nutrient uptake outer membrane protein [Chitinophaga niabensis]|uniref:Starch-binding associating with outer membrane n=1 Tax=Chitinophaga niabensis TaxID=536979 RepID=A0A1N6JZB0_9BACT|nr:RagB/SusD family nutrient uptake outer membrane protein [Chitinophaga niabensis]SIO49675.1 Starch-binding associating with outer membrane [Chitinophaga niabensis]
MNKLILKRYLLLLLLGTGAASCKKQLEEVRPQTTLDQGSVLTDPNVAMTLYYGVYTSFRSQQSNFFVFGEMRSDLWADGLYTESEDGGLKQYWSHNLSQANAPAANWSGFYSLVDRINTVIKLFPLSTVDAAKRSGYLAEMYGLRAYVYYTMLRTWGEVPLTREPVSTVGNLKDLYKARAPKEEVMKQIKADIEQSLTLFGAANTIASGKRVTWNRPATLILKGDVFLWSATHMAGGNADLNTAKTALEEVKALPVLGLQANYQDVFDQTKEANNKEIIFAISYEKDQATVGTYGSFLVNTTQAGTLLLDAGTPQQQSVSAAYPLVGGASRVGMSNAMITKLNNPADRRIRPSFRIMYRNQAGFPIAAVMLTKFLGRVDAGTQLMDTDVPVYRYADVLLLLAEANTKLGGSPVAEINLIRERAYGPGYTPYVNSTTDANMNAILDEYLREFIGEGKRWWALRRAGDTYVYNNVNPAYLSVASSYKLLLPISLGMLNSDPLLKQTFGY